jgi:hypothetical protein
MGKVILHPSAKKIIVRQIMAEVRVIKDLRSICRELKGTSFYSPEIIQQIERIKGRKLEKVK